MVKCSGAGCIPTYRFCSLDKLARFSRSSNETSLYRQTFTTTAYFAQHIATHYTSTLTLPTCWPRRTCRMIAGGVIIQTIFQGNELQHNDAQTTDFLPRSTSSSLSCESHLLPVDQPTLEWVFREIGNAETAGCTAILHLFN
jgi:hypothetical protein